MYNFVRPNPVWRKLRY